MAEKKFNLAMMITANAKQAMEELRRLNNFVDVITSPNQITNGIGMGMGAVKGIASAAIAPMKLFGGAALAAGGSLTAFSIGAMKAAAGDQQLALRLEALYGSGKKAQQVFEEMEKFGRREGIDTENLLEAKIILEQIGVRGSSSLKAVARTASVMNMSMAEVANGIASLSDRSFKKMGIDLAQEGENFVLTFRDKMGQVQKVVAEGSDAAREKLTEILGDKFGDSGLGFNKLLESVKISFGDLFEDFGRPMLKAGESFLNFLRDRLGGLIDSGIAEKWGQVIAEKMEGAVDSIMALFQTMPAIAQTFKNLFSGDADGIKKILKESALAIGEIIMVSIANSLAAMGGLFMGMGKIIASAFMEEILQLPGLGGTRKKMAIENLNSMSEDDRWSYLRSIGVTSHKQKGSTPKELMDQISDSQEATIASMHKGDLMRRGLHQFMRTLPQLSSETIQFAGNRVGRINQAFSDVSGVDVGASFDANLKQIRNARTTGQSLGSGVIIYIDKFEAKANDVREVQDQLIQRAGMSTLAPAGT